MNSLFHVALLATIFLSTVGISSEQKFSKQYDEFAMKYSQIVIENNEDSNEAYFQYFDFPLEGKKVLDLGCGPGIDLMQLQSKNGILYGIDASEKMILIAKENIPDADIKVGLFEAIPFPDQFFDVVISKWGFQNSPEMDPIYNEIQRVLKPGGVLLFLSGHPIRQFLEKKYKGKNYFHKEIVESVFFDGQVTTREPSHTLNEYLSPLFFRYFTLDAYEEGYDSGAEKVGGDTFPSFLIIKARRR